MFLIFYFICLLFTHGHTLHESSDPSAWWTIEALAEAHPYMAAILNQEKEYICSGVVIDRRAILSSGACVTPEPNFVAVGTGVLHPDINKIGLLKVAFAKLHTDYVFDINENAQNISRMHSNIALVFTVLPILEYFFESAVLSNYYATELKEKQLVMVGFGNLTSSEGIVLQQQAYHQMGCKNPKWYYCVCGIEYALMTYDEPFGEGGPVIYDNEIVGIAAGPSGALTSKPNINYNIFTVVGPYIAWIDKAKSDSIVQIVAESVRSNDICKTSSKLLMYVSISFIKTIL